MKIEELINKDYELFIPENNVTSRAIVRNIDTNFSEEELAKYSNTDINSCKILKVRRFSRKVFKEGEVSYVPTGTVCFTFSSKNIPKEVKICGIPFRTQIYMMPVIQCFNCLLFGHTKNLCRSKVRCQNCGEVEHDNTSCTTKCFHCSSTCHKATDRICPEQDRQKQIKQAMSLENISFYEANERFPKDNKKKFVQNLKEFPVINNKVQESPVFTVDQRRTQYINNNTPKSYSSAVKRRKNDRESSWNTGYNKSEHETCLLNANGRQQSRGNVFNSPYYNPNSLNKEEELKQDQVLAKIVNIINNLNNNSKEIALNILTQLTNSEVNLSQGVASTSNSSNDEFY